MWLGQPTVSEPEPEPEPAPEAEPDLANSRADLPNSEAPPLPQQFRAREVARREALEGAAAGVVWALLAASFAVVLVGAVLFREKVVRLFPSVAGAYAAVNLPVNPAGLSLENIGKSFGLSGGRETLVISGLERNIETDPMPPATIKVSLFDKEERKLGEKLALVTGPNLAPGETRAFSVTVIDPPLNLDHFVVAFHFDPRHREMKVKPAAAGPNLVPRPPAPTGGALLTPSGRAPDPAMSGNALSLRGAVAVDPRPSTPVPAQPLPSDSPYALPHAGTPSPKPEPAR